MMGDGRQGEQGNGGTGGTGGTIIQAEQLYEEGMTGMITTMRKVKARGWGLEHRDRMGQGTGPNDIYHHLGPR